MITYTLIFIIITVAVSLYAFNNPPLIQKLILWPKRMDHPSEYYRLLTSGFIHADYVHLGFNMLALYGFGKGVEMFYTAYRMPSFLFPVLYLVGIVVSSLPSFARHKDNGYYRSLGASGGVAAVLFSFIYFAPWQVIYLWFIPIPGIVAAVGYLIYSAYASRKEMDNINHDAHFYGAVFGFVFTLIFAPDHGKLFLQNLLNPHFNF